MSDVPAYIPVSIVAKACGVSKFVARGWLSSRGILERMSGRDCVGEGRLRERLPDAYDRVWSWYAEAHSAER